MLVALCEAFSVWREVGFAGAQQKSVKCTRRKNLKIDKGYINSSLSVVVRHGRGRKYDRNVDLLGYTVNESDASLVRRRQYGEMWLAWGSSVTTKIVTNMLNYLM